MGVEPYLVASSLEAVLAQRLVRVLCKSCKQVDASPAAQTFKAQVEFLPGSPSFVQSVAANADRPAFSVATLSLNGWIRTMRFAG
jgi:type II secretory ATPase GspE/PulE/Tfp pilus assembly ATPase PilB-like protein